MNLETASLEVFHVGPQEDPDRYRLGVLVGAGAEATLYRGYLTLGPDLVLDVGIKMLHPHHRPHLTDWWRRWGEQVELLRSLQAPGVVTVRDGFIGPLPHLAGTDAAGETLYLVMNFVEGVPIDVWTAHSPNVPERERLRSLLPVAAGLDLMHSGTATGGIPVIHGDVKPGNVLVTSQGTVLVDFGMMRSLPGGVRQTTIAGTMSYLAPEVVKEGRYTPAADRYAFGGVAYYLLTQQHPSADHAGLRATLQSRGLDSELIDHVMRTFGDPEERPASLANWCAQLQESTVADASSIRAALPGPSPTGALPTVLPDEGTWPGVVRSVEMPRPPALSRRVRSWIPAVAAVVAIALVVGAVAFAMRDRSGPTPAEPTEFSFGPSVYPNGIVATRQWSIRHDGSVRLHSGLRVVNSAKGNVDGTVDEVIPKSVAPTLDEVRFSPAPAQVVRADPVVRYEIRGLRPSETLEFSYDVPLAGDKAKHPDLVAWAADQKRDDEAYRGGASPATLASVVVTPAAVSLLVGQTYELKVAGTMSDGQPAGPAVLAALAWTSGDPSIASVAYGTVIGKAPGTTTVSAQSGTLRSDVRVQVAGDRPPTRLPTSGPILGGPSITVPTTSSTSTGKQLPQETSTSTSTSTSSSSTSSTTTSSAGPPVGTFLIDDTVYSGLNHFKYSGSGWVATTGREANFNQTGHYSADAGDYFTVTFWGTQAAWYGAFDPTQGIAAVSVDGGSETTVDTYRPGSRQDGQMIYQTPVLAQGQHTLKVRVTGTKNPASTGRAIQVDYAFVANLP